MIDYSLYVVTDEKLSLGKTHTEIAEEAVQGGATMIQLREKEMSSAKLLQTALSMAAVCKNRAAFIVNDRLDIALASGADGVHLGQSDLPVKAARSIAPSSFIIGISAGSVDEAIKGVQDGADYVAVSPVFSTGSKNDAGAGLGLEGIKAMRDAIGSVPLVGIGGINKDNTKIVIESGLDGISVLSAVVSQKDIVAATAELLHLVREVNKK